jgi:hypothetical protein
MVLKTREKSKDMESTKPGGRKCCREEKSHALLKPCIDRLKRVQRKLFVAKVRATNIMGNEILYAFIYSVMYQCILGSFLPTSMWAFSLPNKNSTWMMEPLISFSSTLMSPY